MLTKQRLDEIIATYKPGFARQFGLKNSYSEGMQRLKNFADALPAGELSSNSMATLRLIIDIEELNGATQKVFAAVNAEIEKHPFWQSLLENHIDHFSLAML